MQLIYFNLAKTDRKQRVDLDSWHILLQKLTTSCYQQRSLLKWPAIIWNDVHSDKIYCGIGYFRSPTIKDFGSKWEDCIREAEK